MTSLLSYLRVGNVEVKDLKQSDKSSDGYIKVKSVARGERPKKHKLKLGAKIDLVTKSEVEPKFISPELIPKQSTENQLSLTSGIQGVKQEVKMPEFKRPVKEYESTPHAPTGPQPQKLKNNVEIQSSPPVKQLIDPKIKPTIVQTSSPMRIIKHRAHVRNNIKDEKQPLETKRN